LRQTALACDLVSEETLQAVSARTGKGADEVRAWFNPERGFSTLHRSKLLKSAWLDRFFDLPSHPETQPN
jgi:hypothetical protein